MPATDSYLRNIKTMHVVFCLSVIAFTVSTVVMVYKDHNDEWREYQKEFLRIEAEAMRQELIRAMVAEAGSVEGFKQKADDLKDRLKELNRKLDDENPKYQAQKGKVDKLALEYDLIGRDVRSERAFRDVARANLDIGVRDSVPADELDELEALFDAQQEKVNGLERDWENKETELTTEQVALAVITKARDSLQDEIKVSSAEVVRITDALDQIAPGGGFKSGKRSFMEWPIIDGFNSHLEVKQDWLPELSIKLGMTETARFDRCRTCHLGIDRFGNGNIPTFPHGDSDGEYGHPFSSHPRPDVYLTATSPHPLPEFGCTICHEGQGSATSFHNAQHGANDPHQDHDWHEKYGHFHNHFWEYPMLPERLREASCLKCHHDVIELGVNPTFGATAPKAYRGWQLIQKFGCFGCHEINGFDAGERIGPDLRLEPTAEEAEKYASDPNLIPGTLRKVGPSLKNIGNKVSEGWIARWTRNPMAVRPSTKMPRFFGLTNLKDSHGAKLSDVEIAGIAHFLKQQTGDFDYDTTTEVLTAVLKTGDSKELVAAAKAVPEGKYTPDSATGRRLFAEKGCLGCHAHDAKYKSEKTGDDLHSFEGADSDFGPNITNIGEKLDPETAFDWLYTWIRDPQRHHPRSRMPNLFIEPYVDTKGNYVDPAADIAAFLIGDGPKEEYKTPPLDGSTVKELARLHLGGKALTRDGFEKFWQTRKFPIPKNDIKGDEIELVHDGDEIPTDAEWVDMTLNYIGRRSISRYGCYGCHDIAGFGTARPIGTALQDWGRKDTTRLAPEHIHEFLHHHGQQDAQGNDIGSTQQFVEQVMKNAASDSFESEEEKEDALRTAFFYESLINHGRPGFIFQKLRDPRSYDHKKIEAKTYVERLVMPEFPLNNEDIEAISTFVLGLVAEPPAAKYVFMPDARTRDRMDGEILLQRFNCVACHMIDMHEMEYGSGFDDLTVTEITPSDYPQAIDRFLEWRRPQNASAGGFVEIDDEYNEGAKLRLPTVRVNGMILTRPNEDDPGYSMDLWEPVDVSELIAHHAAELRKQKTQLQEKVGTEVYESAAFTRLEEAMSQDEGVDDARDALKAEVKGVAAGDGKRPPTALKLARAMLGRWFNNLQPERPLTEAEGIDVDLARDVFDLALEAAGEPFEVPEDASEAQKAALTAHNELLKQQLTTIEGLADGLFFELEAYDNRTRVVGPQVSARYKIALPGSRVTFSTDKLVHHKPAHGGQFAEWLVDRIVANNERLDPYNGTDRYKAWSKVPPPLHREGQKVQTDWLFSFLKEPGQIRFSPVLRMPKFTMSDDEARVFANYFAAADGSAYPYEGNPQAESPYIERQQAAFETDYAARNAEHREALRANADFDSRMSPYMFESWRMLTTTLCIKCHSVGGKAFIAAPNDPNVSPGPLLNNVSERLRSEWVSNWVFNPKRITPYTAMPVPFVNGKQSFPEVFNGNGLHQTIGVRDALMNYQRLMEQTHQALPSIQPPAPANPVPAAN